MDAVLLARIQFAFTVGFHFLFPPTTFGLTLVIVILETLYLRTKSEIYKKLSSFLVKVLGLVFVMGTATGIVMEFAFGNNWAEYSRMVGDIFGAPLAAEGVFAFFLESVFLGILLFGRNRVSEKTYWWSSFLVFFGAHLSGLWIIIANSWMQTPAGFKIENGKAVLTDFWAAAFNPSTVERYTHTVVAGWITGSLFVAAIAAWYLLKKRHIDYSKLLLKTAVLVFIGTSFLQFVTGHHHSVQVAVTQPAKMAAFEALWETQKGAPLVNFGIPDEEAEETHYLFEFPKLLSFLVYGDFNAEMKGLKDFPKDERPPVLLSFGSYHIMVFIGVWFAMLSLAGLYLLFKKKMYESRWFLYVLLFSVPLPYLANEFGWMAAEVGRQPWVVYGVMKTADAVSKVVPAGQILFSLILFALVYALLFYVFIKILGKIVKKGPETLAPQGY
jgi:cytochrome bd ubiquinol oxidase subunit I